MKEKGGNVRFISVAAFTKMHETSFLQDPRIEITAGERANSNAFHYSL